MRAINQPVSWWGWHWEPSVPMSVIELIQAGSMSPRLAALFWVAMERGASLIIAADPPSSGKTTTLTALLSFTPPETAAYFTRGLGEPFALPPLTDSYPIYLLINEMSDHLPVYTWHDYARRAFELLAGGYSLASTMHADTVDGVIGQLAGELGIPRRQIANLNLIVTLHLDSNGARRRRVLDVAFLRPHGDDLAVGSIARWQRERDEFEVLADAGQREEFGRWAGLPPPALDVELERREAFLRRLLEQSTAAIPEVNAAIERFYGESLSGREA